MRHILNRLAPVVHSLTRSRPVPLSFWTRARTLGRGVDLLAPPAAPVEAAVLRDCTLAAVLAGRELGVWTLGPKSIDYLEGWIRRHQPSTVLEFGSGVSTACIAHFLGSLTGPRRLISLEQRAANVLETHDLVRSLSVRAVDVRVVHAPLVQRPVGGTTMSVYDLESAELAHIAGRRIDAVFIDGPAAEPGARYATLVGVQDLVQPGAPVLLDDALRDGELEAAGRWRTDGVLEVQGIVPVEHGLLVGRFRGSRPVEREPAVVDRSGLTESPRPARDS